MFPEVLLAKKPYQVACEFPMPSFNPDGTTTAVGKSAPMGIIEADVEDHTLRVDSDTYQALWRKCVEHEDFPQRLGIKPSLVAEESGLLGKTYYPVGSTENGQAYRQSLAQSRQLTRSPENTAVFLFHGTCSAPQDLHNKAIFHEGELLSFLGEKLRLNGVEEGVGFHRVYGVGSGNIQNTNLNADFMAHQAHSGIMGQAFGSGALENVDHAVLTLKGETLNPANEEEMSVKGPQLAQVGRVVLVGWSRGAVTAINFARALWEDPALRNIEVYLFAIDPVPGLGNITLGTWKRIHHLYPNVKKYFGVYARDERSVGFTANIPVEVDEYGLSTGRNSNRTIIEFPGNHATLVGNARDIAGNHAIFENEPGVKDKSKRINLSASPRAIRGLAQLFIMLYSNKLQSIEYYRDKEDVSDINEYLRKDFGKMAVNLEDYAALRNKAYIPLGPQRIGTLRKYHEEWNLFKIGFLRFLDTFVSTIAPRYTAEYIPGFHYRQDLDNHGIRNYVNWMQILLEKRPDLPPELLFENPSIGDLQ
jgi:hypothetical protein